MNNFIETKEFIDHLNSWLFKSNTKDASWIYANRNKIPVHFRRNSNYLYKGLIGNSELFTFKTGFVRLNGTISFSEDENIAKQFATNSKFNFRDKSGVKIIIKKKFSNVVFDVYKYFLFNGDDRLLEMGFDDMNIDSMKKEKEILVNDVKVYSKDFYIIK